MTYITHARTLEELRDEVLSDLRRRIERLELQVRHAKNSAENAKNGRAIDEFKEALHYWTEITLARSTAKAKPPAQAGQGS